MDELKHDIDSSRYAQLLSRYCRALQGDDTANVNRHYNFLRQHTSDFVEKRITEYTLKHFTGLPNDYVDPRDVERKIERAMEKSNRFIDRCIRQRKEDKMTLKLVQYYVVDPDPRLPEHMHILVEGTAVIRDETEFKVNLNLPHLLKQHNELRGTVEPDENILNINAGQLVLKKEMLKPIPIRKLRIIINTIEEWMCE